MNDLMSLAKTGSLVLGGFVVHRVLTGAACDALMKNVTGELANWRKPLCGAGVFAVGVGLVTAVGKGMAQSTRTALGAGMAVSWLQSVAVSALTAFGQPQLVTYLEGYTDSTASRLRGYGRRRRGMRGLGQGERNARSIMPRYAPVGQYRQAAAGTGEYFAPRQQMGEYFASNNLQGVGYYEEAGPLALQPSRSATGQLPIDDGIRPDANLDEVMMLAESAAGLGQGWAQAQAGVGQYQQAAAGMGRARGRRGMRGLGAYFAAKPANGGFDEYRVPTSNQWVPNGPLWAGTIGAGDTSTESEIPAGILQGPGGNGVLSG